jgi:phage terminase Nu1 subunit (DNA packaging protein)
MKPEIVTTRNLAGLFSCTPRWIIELAAQGMPGRVGRGKFDLNQVLPWWVRRLSREILERNPGSPVARILREEQRERRARGEVWP